MDFDYHLAQRLSPPQEVDEETKNYRANNRWNGTYTVIDYITAPEWRKVVKQLPGLHKWKEILHGATAKKIYDILLRE